jgi:putative ABC transport system permease protein
MSIRRRLQSVLWRVPIEQEVREELAHHVELRTEELIARGVEPSEARRQALARLGNPARMTTTLTSIGRRRDRTFARREWLSELRQDLAFALRQARRQPGFTLAAVLTLALGIGATTAIYGVVHAVLLKPFPMLEPDRVLRAYTRWRDNAGSTSVGNYDYIRQRVQTIEHLAAAGAFNVTLSDDGVPERVPGAQVTWSYFRVFDVAPLHGRVFSADEDQPGAGHVVVLSHRLWQRRFGGDLRILGQQIRLSGIPHDVIGVMPPSFREIAEREELWTPTAFTAEQLATHDGHYLQMYGLRRADVTLAQVNDELTRIAQSLAVDFPHDNVDRGASAEPFDVSVVGNYRTRLYVLLGAVLIVLLTACGNVANLLLARLAARSRELAIRAAIGAGRWRIVRQVMTESLVLAMMGGLAGVVAASWALPLLIARAPAGVPRLATASLDLSVIGTALLLVLGTTALVGLLPALLSTRGDLNNELGDGKGASGRTLRPWVRQSLIAAQAAMVVIVLAGAALLIRSAIKLEQVPIGFDTSGVLLTRVALPSVQYRTPAVVKATFDDLETRLRSAPGVAGVALDSQAPLLGFGGSNGLIPEGRAIGMGSVIPSQSHFVSAEYFHVLRIPMVAGRAFTDADIRSAPLVMIINHALARAAFGDDDPIGKRISCCEAGPEGPDAPMWKIVVGVAADIRTRGPATAPRPEFYLPIAQIPDVGWSWVENSMNLMMRVESGDPAALVSVVRDAVRTVDPSLPVFGVTTMDEGLARTMAQARFNTTLMTLLGASALLLAALGIYSVIAWLVAQRTREIGLRMALGASAGEVVRRMTLHGLKPVVAGLSVGLLGALGVGRFIEGQLFNTGARDPLAIGAVVALLLTVAIIASIVPAWRAASVDPSKALREG